MEKKTNLKALLEEGQKKVRKPLKAGHITHTKKILQQLRAELSEKEFQALTPGPVLHVVMTTMPPAMREWVERERGRKFYNQVAVLLRDEKHRER